MKWLLVTLSLLASPAFAVQPDEMLSNPALEARAREISKGLRCPVCQNENIDDSNAAISRELRILLRERLVEGDSDQEAVDFIVSRYGEFVLLRPDAEGANLVLWLAPPLMAALGLGIGWATSRRRKRAPDEALSAVEEILKSLRVVALF